MHIISLEVQDTCTCKLYTIGYCTVVVVREMGARGRVSVPISTKPGTAKGNGDDYEDIDEMLHFDDGESR